MKITTDLACKYILKNKTRNIISIIRNKYSNNSFISYIFNIFKF